MRVLTVEDDRTISSYVKRGLEEQGHIDAQLGALRAAADAEDVTAASDAASSLRDLLAGLGVAPG